MTLLVAALLGTGYLGLANRYNPFAPLEPADAPTLITRYKLAQLNHRPEACMARLAEARRQGMIQYQVQGNREGECPLNHVVRVTGFGGVGLNHSFLASCPLALRSAMFIYQQASPLTLALTGSALTQVDHLGSFACRNIYHRASARRSEHATADALDVSGFRLADGRRIAVLNNWGRDGPQGALLSALARQGCRYYGNVLGPDYNAAHATHFHFGTQGFGFCR